MALTTTRADRIFQILKEVNGRLQVAEIAKRLCQLEEVQALSSTTVSATVAQDNRTRDNAGRAPRFLTYGDGDEEWGYISIRPPTGQATTSSTSQPQIVSNAIETANEKARSALKLAISKLSWQEFEANFLVRVLEALGFRNIALTQPTRDGGKDAECEYERGLVASKAIVSAKHWQINNVPVSEVQRLRGIKGDSDTAIIVTSASFTNVARLEAAPSQNQRSVVLVDGNLIVETCISNSIGVRAVNLPTLYEFVDFDVIRRNSEG